ncbi:MAG: hypothetical protein U0R50_04120 [Gaiellales bacterium]
MQVFRSADSLAKPVVVSDELLVKACAALSSGKAASIELRGDWKGFNLTVDASASARSGTCADVTLGVACDCSVELPELLQLVKTVASTLAVSSAAVREWDGYGGRFEPGLVSWAEEELFLGLRYDTARVAAEGRVFRLSWGTFVGSEPWAALPRTAARRILATGAILEELPAGDGTILRYIQVSGNPREFPADRYLQVGEVLRPVLVVPPEGPPRMHEYREQLAAARADSRERRKSLPGTVEVVWVPEWDEAVDITVSLHTSAELSENQIAALDRVLGAWFALGESSGFEGWLHHVGERSDARLEEGWSVVWPIDLGSADARLALECLTRAMRTVAEDASITGTLFVGRA